MFDRQEASLSSAIAISRRASTSLKRWRRLPSPGSEMTATATTPMRIAKPMRRRTRWRESNSSGRSSRGRSGLSVAAIPQTYLALRRLFIEVSCVRSHRPGGEQLEAVERERMRPAAADREHLEHGDLARVERTRRAGHVELPGPGALAADEADGAIPGGAEVVDPVAQRERVVLAQRLDVTDLERLMLHRPDDPRERLKLAVGEDVARDERARVRRIVVQGRDPVVEQEPARPEEVVDGADVARERGAADVLVHADARDLVEPAVAELTVVGDADLDAVAEPMLGRTPAGERRLRPRQRDAGRAHAVVLGGVQHERAPAAADVEEPLPGLQRELAADHVELALLRVLEGVRGVAEVGTRVDEARSEHEPVEVVGDVVVVADRATVAHGRVAPVAVGLDRRHGRSPERRRAGDAERAEREPRAIAWRERDLPQRAAQGEQPLEVVLGDERPVDVGAGEAELARRVQQVGERAAVAHGERREVGAGVLGSQQRAVPEAQPDRHLGERSAGDLGKRRPRPLGGRSAAEREAREGRGAHPSHYKSVVRRTLGDGCPPVRGRSAKGPQPRRRARTRCTVTPTRTHAAIGTTSEWSRSSALTPLSGSGGSGIPSASVRRRRAGSNPSPSTTSGEKAASRSGAGDCGAGSADAGAAGAEATDAAAMGAGAACGGATDAGAGTGGSASATACGEAASASSAPAGSVETRGDVAGADGNRPGCRRVLSAAGRSVSTGACAMDSSVRGGGSGSVRPSVRGGGSGSVRPSVRGGGSGSVRPPVTRAGSRSAAPAGWLTGGSSGRARNAEGAGAGAELAEPGPRRAAGTSTMMSVIARAPAPAITSAGTRSLPTVATGAAAAADAGNAAPSRAAAVSGTASLTGRCIARLAPKRYAILAIHRMLQGRLPIPRTGDTQAPGISGRGGRPRVPSACRRSGLSAGSREPWRLRAAGHSRRCAAARTRRTGYAWPPSRTRPVRTRRAGCVRRRR